jgi:threonine/homoserine efflux transporter RhtA
VNRIVAWLVLALVALAVLTQVTPMLIRLAHAALPLVVAMGCVLAALRIVWYFTSRY